MADTIDDIDELDFLPHQLTFECCGEWIVSKSSDPEAIRCPHCGEIGRAISGEITIQSTFHLTEADTLPEALRTLADYIDSLKSDGYYPSGVYQSHASYAVDLDRIDGEDVIDVYRRRG